VSQFQKILRALKFMVTPYHPPRRPAFYTDELEKEPRYRPRPLPHVVRKTPESEFLQELRAACQRNTIDADPRPIDFDGDMPIG
jgi:hypothetical protein